MTRTTTTTTTSCARDSWVRWGHHTKNYSVSGLCFYITPYATTTTTLTIHSAHHSPFTQCVFLVVVVVAVVGVEGAFVIRMAHSINCTSSRHSVLLLLQQLTRTTNETTPQNQRATINTSNVRRWYRRLLTDWGHPLPPYLQHIYRVCHQHQQHKQMHTT